MRGEFAAGCRHGLWALDTQVASTDPHPHTQGLLLHSEKNTFIHNKSVPNPCGAWTAHVQQLDVHMCGLEFVLNEPCSSYPAQTCEHPVQLTQDVAI